MNWHRKLAALDPAARSRLAGLIEAEGSVFTLFPLSYTQEVVWWGNRLQPGTPMYNTPMALRLTGDLDVPTLERSLREIVVRHEVLRTTFHLLGRTPVQAVNPAPDRLDLPVTDLRGLPLDERDAEAERLAFEERRRPFAPTEDLLLRAGLLRTDDRTHILLLTTHQLAFDDWSAGIAIRELTALYTAFRAGEPSPLEPLPIQYADYALWQRRWMDDARQDKEFAYWSERLAGVPELLDMPADLPRPARRGVDAHVHNFALPDELTEAVVRLSGDAGVTPFMTLTAAFHLMLSRRGGERRFVTSTLTASRDRPETGPVIGDFATLLFLPADLGDHGLTFRELMVRTRDTLLDVQEHAGMPAHRLAGRLRPRRDPSCNPVSQAMFYPVRAMHTVATLAMADLEVGYVAYSSPRAGTAFDVELRLFEEPGRMKLQFICSSELYLPDGVAELARHFTGLVEAAVAGPERPLDELPDPAASVARSGPRLPSVSGADRETVQDGRGPSGRDDS